jgi:hypothetical protein
VRRPDHVHLFMVGWLAALLGLAAVLAAVVP